MASVAGNPAHRSFCRDFTQLITGHDKKFEDVFGRYQSFSRGASLLNSEDTQRHTELCQIALFVSKHVGCDLKRINKRLTSEQRTLLQRTTQVILDTSKAYADEEAISEANVHTKFQDFDQNIQQARLDSATREDFLQGNVNMFFDRIENVFYISMFEIANPTLLTHKSFVIRNDKAQIEENIRAIKKEQGKYLSVIDALLRKKLALLQGEFDPANYDNFVKIELLIGELHSQYRQLKQAVIILTKGFRKTKWALDVCALFKEKDIKWQMIDSNGQLKQLDAKEIRALKGHALPKLKVESFKLDDERADRIMNQLLFDNEIDGQVHEEEAKGD